MQFRSSAALLAVILEATTAGTHAFATAPAHRLVAMHRRRSPRRGQPASAPFESTSIKGTASDPASKRVRLETGDVAGVVAQHANQVSIPSHLDQSKVFSEGLLGLVASFVISLAVLAIALVSPFVSDGEAMVARCIPTRLAHFLRDRWQSWAVFNRWTWALVAPGLALTRFDLLRQLLEKHGQDLDVPYNDCSHAREIPSAARRTLDIFHHGEPSKSAPRPVVVFVHGGAWSHGSKELVRLLGKKMRDAGFVSVCIGYRRYPLARTVWDAADDVGAALDYVSTNITRYGGDARKVVLVAHSSGAHISALHLLSRMKAVTEAGDGQQGLGLHSFIGLSGVYDINAHYEHEKKRGVHEISALKPANGFSPAEFAAASPTALARELAEKCAKQWDGETPGKKPAPPPQIRLVHCKDDSTVPFSSSTDLWEALARVADGAGAEPGAVRVELLEEGGHASLLREVMLAKTGGLGAGEEGDIAPQEEPFLLQMVRDVITES